MTGKTKIYVLVLSVLQALSGGTGVLYALYLRNIVDCAAVRDRGGFTRNVICLIILVAVTLILSALIRGIRELAKADTENLFKIRLTDDILRKDYSAVSAVHTGEWLNRLTNDTVVVTNGFVEIVPGFIGMIIRLITALIMIIALDKWFAYIMIPGGIIIVLLTYSFRKILKRLHKRIQESDGRLRVFLQERIGSLQIIKAFTAEDQVREEALLKMADHRKARLSRSNFSNFANLGFGAALHGMYLIGIIYCAEGIITGTVTYGTLTAIIQLIAQIEGPFANLSGFIPRWYSMTASAERLMEVEEYADDKKVMSHSEALRIYNESFSKLGLRGAGFSYPADEDGNRVKVLDNYDLEIKKGEFIAFTGYSGCGKSTVLKLLLGLYPLDEGQMYIDDSVLDVSYRSLFAYVPQGNYLMNGSVRDAVSFGRTDVGEESIREALHIACADEFITDLDLMLGEKGSGLSEGQLQRIAIGRAICSGGPILLLDEATSALDSKTEKKLLDNLRSLTDKTVIIVTHRPAALSVCDRVIEFSSDSLQVSQ